MSGGTITIAEIQAQAAAYFGVSLADMKSPVRRRSVARPRQVAMYLARRVTGQSFPVLGRMFGGKDHTTVIHACRNVDALMHFDAAFRAQVEDLSARLGMSSGERIAA